MHGGMRETFPCTGLKQGVLFIKAVGVVLKCTKRAVGDAGFYKKYNIRPQKRWGGYSFGVFHYSNTHAELWKQIYQTYTAGIKMVRYAPARTKTIRS